MGHVTRLQIRFGSWITNQVKYVGYKSGQIGIGTGSRVKIGEKELEIGGRNYKLGFEL